MDEGHKRVLLIDATILGACKLAQQDLGEFRCKGDVIGEMLPKALQRANQSKSVRLKSGRYE